jgi:DNA-directed RNA polymerase subunit RPC12/RpoP
MVSIETAVGRLSSVAHAGRCEAFRGANPESLARTQCDGLACWRWDRPVNGTLYYCDACARDAFPEIAAAEADAEADVRCRHCGSVDAGGCGVCDACMRRLDADDGWRQ